jgi:hypothetical protein
MADYPWPMPTGGVDNCGECQFNPASGTRVSGLHPSVTGTSSSCDLRRIAVIPDPFYTYCANFHTHARIPDGPVFAGFHEFGRLPWHGKEPVRISHTDQGIRLLVRDAETDRQFDTPADYISWWRTRHKGENPQYPWDRFRGTPTGRLMFEPTPRRSLLQRLRARISR